MAKPKLVVVDERYLFWLRWQFEDDEGATLGDSLYTDEELAKASPDDRDHLLATITAGKTDGAKHSPPIGYYWDTRDEAARALRVVKVALKNDTGAPWPEWTVKALAAGWTAPKGWKP